ncbi:MAG: DUF1284 domain-containing protein [Deltaproteobacteria bacterium]|nr:DUF1284 domain-containing protein [Deltaproteobacteria bacterium]
MPIRLRGHHLLCLRHFRGLGYDEAFTANVARVVDALRSPPDDPVQVVDGPDDVCAACPHLADTVCARGPRANEAVRSHDGAVLAALGLRPGDATTWAAVGGTLEADGAARDAATAGCVSCPWARLCAEDLTPGGAPRPG